MFKRITSNRDPRDTLLSELKKEFGVHYVKVGDKGQQLVNHYPRFVFGSMIALMLVSMALSFTVFRNREAAVKKKAPITQKSNPITTGFGQLLQTGEALRETIALKQQVDSLIAKKHLSKTDSATLERSLDRLQQINQHVKR